MIREGALRLRDGRALAYAESGDPSGRPVLYFHGTPGSRLLHPDANGAADLGVRVVGVDRPGFGRSDFQPGRTFLDWPKDVAELADALGFDRFPVVGTSGGTPYAMACGHTLPDRVTRVGLIGTGAPMDMPGITEGIPRERRIGAAVAGRAPWLIRPLLWLLRNPGRDPERFAERYTAHICESDRAILARPEAHAMKVASYGEAARAGVRGFAHEVTLFARPWGFRLEDVAVEVLIWHGDEDNSTPPAMARYVAEAFPNCRARYFPGEGHFLFIPRWREILTELLA